LVLKNYKNKRLKFSTDLKNSVKKSDIVFICVGTPVKKMVLVQILAKYFQ
jgi:UDPglucose 6-dehydrogenase